MRILSREIINFEGKEIELAGWVDVRRDHGKLIFIDLRDRGGIAQIVFAPNNKDLHKKADSSAPEGRDSLSEAERLRSEWVVGIRGIVQKRPAGMENPKIPSGNFEISATSLEIFSEANTPPFDLSGSGLEIGEDTRMKYRYLDLRRLRLQNNLKNRAKVLKFIRDFLNVRDFTEIETPILTKSTPEGARDYLVPSRLQSGNFYALPQSPQQYKQLLMVAGFERYFQIARCFRDEDTRGDRQPEFTQLDLEMSFVEKEDVMKINEELLIDLVKNLYPEKKIQEIPFPILTYEETMKKYGTDKPDLRKNKEDANLLAFCWIIDFPFFEKRKDGGWTFTHNPFSAPKPEFMDLLLKIGPFIGGKYPGDINKDIGEILTSQYDIALNGWEIGGGSIRNHTEKALTAVFNIIGHEDPRDFEHMFDAFEFGAPPHGGIAWGFDRLMMVLQNEPNIREVIAFPKTGDGRDLMMEAPSEVSKEQLKELHLKIDKKD